jgi:predicted nucleic acid-binding Zn ribbon protein
MALYVPGQACSVCGRVIERGSAVVMLPPFTGNEADPLFTLSDAVAHSDCIDRHPHAGRLSSRLAEFNHARSEPVKRCIVCNQPITNPDLYFTFGYLGDDESAQKWNYANFHRNCLSQWGELPEVILWTDRAIERGDWTQATMRLLQAVLLEAQSGTALGTSTRCGSES